MSKCAICGRQFGFGGATDYAHHYWESKTAKKMLATKWAAEAAAKHVLGWCVYVHSGKIIYTTRGHE